ncbi:MAG: tetratricopeptide repeat protein [Alphaproteobacteria bacterium]|nr:tetratricopeptide repeat protein [Alphaproteobacteria bacterium]MBT5860666.1 tetratricopeptide repeat protein [Alphaproteobacteria bacterium]
MNSNTDETVSAAPKGLTADSADIEVFLAEAVRHAATGSTDRAIDLYDQILVEDPNHVIAQTNVGALRAATGNLDAAADHFRKALAADPDNGLVAFHFGNLFYAQGQFEAALSYFQIAVNGQPEVFEPALNIGLSLHQLGRMEEALGILELVVSEHPDRFEGHAALANLYFSSGQRAKSIQSYQTALTINGDDADLLARMAMAQISDGQNENALASSARAVELAENSIFVYQVRARILGDLRHHQEAIAIISKAMGLPGGNSTEVLSLAGMILENAAMKDQALKAYQMVLQSEPENGEILGRILDLKGRLCDWQDYDHFIGQIETFIDRNHATGAPFDICVMDLTNVPITLTHTARAIQNRVRTILDRTAATRATVDFNFDDRLARARVGEARKIRVGCFGMVKNFREVYPGPIQPKLLLGSHFTLCG